MKKSLFLSLLCWLTVCCTAPFLSLAQTTPPDSAAAPATSIKGLIPIPVIYYTPDTRLGVGAAVIGFLRLKSRYNDTYTRLSTGRILVDYTLNKQTDQQMEWNVFTREEKYLLRGELRHRVYTDRFYGIGNNTPETDEGKYKYSLVGAKLAVLKKLSRHTFLGVDYQLTNYYDLRLDSISGDRESLLQTQHIAGYQGGLNSGVGLIFLFDTRDNTAYASSGMLLEASAYRFGKPFGGDFNYKNFNLIFSKFFELRPGRVLASNTAINLNNGAVPLMRRSAAGGDRILRGYARNRFLDNNFAGTQLEYRFPLYRRLGMAAFAGIGDVFDKPADVNFSTLKYSLGTGLRYALNQEQKLNLRFDLGYGSEGANFYIVIGEAF